MRATVVALRAAKDDQDLQSAVREELTAHRKLAQAGPSVGPRPSRRSGTRSENCWRSTNADKGGGDTFAREKARLAKQIATLEAQEAARQGENCTGTS